MNSVDPNLVSLCEYSDMLKLTLEESSAEEGSGEERTESKDERIDGDRADERRNDLGCTRLGEEREGDRTESVQEEEDDSLVRELASVLESEVVHVPVPACERSVSTQRVVDVLVEQSTGEERPKGSESLLREARLLARDLAFLNLERDELLGLELWGSRVRFASRCFSVGELRGTCQ